MTEPIPQHETPRLVLRAFRSSDLDAYAAICADAEVMRTIGNGEPADRTSAWRQMAVFNGHWTLEGSSVWAVELKDEACCQPANARSIQLATSLGAVADGDCERVGQRTLRYLHRWP